MAQDWTDDCFDAGHVGQTDLQNMEDNFQCLKSCFSGTSAPSNPVAGMLWFNTSSGILYQRNSGNSAWKAVWDVNNGQAPTDSVVTSSIKDSAVTESKIATNAVTAGKIASGSIVEAKLATGAVTTNKLADGVVSEPKLGSSAVTAGKIATFAVTPPKLAQGMLWLWNNSSYRTTSHVIAFQLKTRIPTGALNVRLHAKLKVDLNPYNDVPARATLVINNNYLSPYVERLSDIYDWVTSGAINISSFAGSDAIVEVELRHGNASAISSYYAYMAGCVIEWW